ncbi:hypothetical protein VP01_1867g1 [Puccinia sorghi]|uniref:RRM domain-containing protein n=1 Tax=Puccinia sorghi TaxID=27349 RepID=A0A0L6VDV8_9BASI|nr:hypothetical protein VP01_1867g1 [Puccinia sorghi]
MHHSIHISFDIDRLTDLAFRFSLHFFLFSVTCVVDLSSQRYPGFQSVRLVPGRTGIAFVQYDTAAQSDMAKAALDGFKLAPGVVMKVSFARRG